MSLSHALGATFLLVLTGCAGTHASAESAEKACTRAIYRQDRADGCDAYVAAAVESRDTDAIFRAYSLRAVLREHRGDLSGAIADAEQAIAIAPDLTYGHLRRAALIGETGDYAQALKLFAEYPDADSPHGFEENLAMLEYVAGDRTRSVGLFQTAAIDYAQGGSDSDEDMAAAHRFTAAIIESELKGGDLAPIAAQDVAARTDTMLPLLKQHRMGEMSDAQLIARVDAMIGPAGRGYACDGYFSVGHRNVLAGNAPAARQAFDVAVERCTAITFEHHAAKAWLKQLGG